MKRTTAKNRWRHRERRSIPLMFVNSSTQTHSLALKKKQRNRKRPRTRDDFERKPHIYKNDQEGENEK